MPKKLFALLVLSSVMTLCCIFKEMGLTRCNRVPYFRLSLVYVIDCRKIEVFLMPAEKGFPCANIAIRLGHSFDHLGHRVLQN